jgi:hypothetical protein
MLMRCLPVLARTAVCPATVNRALSKSACVRGGASSEVSGIAVVEIGFMAVSLAHGNDTERVIGFDVNDQLIRSD